MTFNLLMFLLFPTHYGTIPGLDHTHSKRTSSSYLRPIAWKGGRLLQEEPAEVLIKITGLLRLKISKIYKTLLIYEFVLIYALSLANAPVLCIFPLISSSV